MFQCVVCQRKERDVLQQRIGGVLGGVVLKITFRDMIDLVESGRTIAIDRDSVFGRDLTYIFNDCTD